MNSSPGQSTRIVLILVEIIFKIRLIKILDSIRIEIIKSFILGTDFNFICYSYYILFHNRYINYLIFNIRLISYLVYPDFNSIRFKPTNPDFNK